MQRGRGREECVDNGQVVAERGYDDSIVTLSLVLSHPEVITGSTPTSDPSRSRSTDWINGRFWFKFGCHKTDVFIIRSSSAAVVFNHHQQVTETRDSELLSLFASVFSSIHQHQHLLLGSWDGWKLNYHSYSLTACLELSKQHCNHDLINQQASVFLYSLP